MQITTFIEHSMTVKIHEQLRFPTKTYYPTQPQLLIFLKGQTNHNTELQTHTTTPMLYTYA